MKFDPNKKIVLTLFIWTLFGLLLLTGCSGEMPTGVLSGTKLSAGASAPPLEEIDIIHWTSSDKQEFTADDPSNIQFKLESVTAHYHQNQGCYKSCKIKLDDGTSFKIDKGALTPPAGWPEGKDVTITMQVETRPLTNEIIYSFGPSGCQFNPSAELWLSWKVLQCNEATLYYLNDKGKKIEQLPDNIDLKNKKMCIRIDHFSRYSVSYSD